MDWVYGQAIGFLGNFFALMGNMGVELFELEWVSAIILFFSRLAWALTRKVYHIFSLSVPLVSVNPETADSMVVRIVSISWV